MPESAGDRIFEIRQALGTGPRDPLPLEQFAERLARVTGRNYDPSQLSKLERGKQRLTVQIAEDIAKLDPKQRGPWWIAWGVEVSGEVRGDESPAGTGVGGSPIVESGPLTDANRPKPKGKLVPKRPRTA